MKLNVAELVLLASLLCDLASSKLTISPQYMIAQEGQGRSVICRDEATGEGATWRGPKNRKLGEKTKPQSRTTSYGQQLMFEKISAGDFGTYTCKTKSEIAEFVLSEEGAIKFVDTPAEQEGMEGENITIKCEAKAAVTSWLVDGDIPQSPKYAIIADALVVVNATKKDAKSYICKAVNEEAGTMDEISIDLKVTHKPRLPPNTTERHYMKDEFVYGFIGGTVHLNCEVEAEPPPKFTWFKRNNKEIIGEEISGISPYKSVLKLKITQMNGKDVFKCMAKNDFGSIEIVFRLLVGTQPAPPYYLELLEATSDTFTLEIDGPIPTEEELNSKMAPLGYQVEYRPTEGNFVWEIKRFPIDEGKNYTLTELAHTTQYEVRAATENRAGLSDYTNSSFYDTASAAANTSEIKTSLVVSCTFGILLILFNVLFDSHI